jgi:hydrogenase maturation protein HypF
VGAELKNTFCLSKEKYAFLSHHIGDMENTETLKSFTEAITHYENMFRVKPIAIACDLHPDYLASRYASDRACKEEIPLIPVQHHHAHLAACLADNQWNAKEPVIGVILDGTGLGTDDTIWGGEFLLGNYAGFERTYHLRNTPQPGGDAATRVPARMALAHLWNSGIPWSHDLAPVQYLTAEEINILERQLEKGINTPLTSSMGRLFDAAASLMDIRQSVNYEAQAAIELEALCAEEESGFYPFEMQDSIIDPTPLWKALISDIREKIPTYTMAARFHNSVIEMILSVVNKMHQKNGIRTVALSGGVWQNMYLLDHSVRRLKTNGYRVFWHKHVPTNDGGIALGQIMIAMQAIKKI